MKLFENKNFISNYQVYEDGRILNINLNKFIKPSIDIRRPNQPPLVYFKYKDGKRLCMYQDEFIAMMFLPEYKKGCAIHHLDNDPLNCRLDNLVIVDGVKTLKEVYNETKRWTKVDIGKKLYYDYYICEDGRLYNGSADVFVKPFQDKRDKNIGYLRYNLYVGKKNTDIIHYSAARLVAHHFLPIIEGKDIVLYKDGNRENVDVSNLYFGDDWDAMTKHIEDESKESREFCCLYEPILGKEKWKSLNKVFEKFNIDIEPRDEYMISNFGRVYNKTKSHYCIQSDSKQCNANGQYYKLIGIHIINNDDMFNKFLRVHRLVALAFVKNDDYKAKNTVNHINGNPSCNLAYNLEWVTPYDNLHHAIETNLLHSNRFDGHVDDKNWRINTIFAVIFGMYTTDINVGYKIYAYYKEKYKDNIPVLSKDEFESVYNEKQNDSDYIKLYNFYAENYSKK